MQLTHLVALIPFVASLAAAASSWTAFLYTGYECGQTGTIVATIRGSSGPLYQTADYNSTAVAHSVSFQWETPNPPVESGIESIFSFSGDGHPFEIGAGYGNACVKSASDFEILALRTADCAKVDCKGGVNPNN